MKPDKVTKIIIIISVILMLISGYMSYSGVSYFLSGERPFNNETDFKSLYSATGDMQGNIYRIDRSRKRITKTSSKGNVEFEIDLNQSNKKGKASFSRLEAGDDNLLYAVRINQNSENSYEEQILQYQCDTVLKKEKVLYTIAKSKPTEEITELRFYKNSLYFIQVKEVERGQSVSVYMVSKDSTEPALITDFVLPKEYCMNKITYEYRSENSHTFYFTNKKGEIFRYLKETSEFTKIYGDEKSNPVYIQVGNSSETQLIFADQYSRTIRLLDLSLFKNQGFLNITQTKELLSEQQFRGKLIHEAQPEKVFLICESMHVLNNDIIVCDISDCVVMLDTVNADEIKIISEKAEYKWKSIAVKILRYLLPLAVFIIFAIIFFSLTYKYYIKRIILLKQFFWSALFIAMIFTFVGAVFITQIQSILTGEIERQLESKAGIGVAGLDTANFEKIKSTSDFGSQEFCKLRNYLKMIQEEEPVPDSSISNQIGGRDILSPIKRKVSQLLKPSMEKMQYYSILYKVESYGKGNYLYNFCVMDDDHRSPFHPYFIPDAEDKKKYNDSIDSDKTVFFDNQEDASGKYMLCLKRIKLNSGEYGLYEIGVDRGAYTECIAQVSFKLECILFISLVFIVGVIFLSTWRILKPLKQLTVKLDSFDGKTWGSGLSINTGDELETLSNSFNKMNTTLQNYITDIEDTRNAYARFVPRQINKYLDGKNIVDIRLKDHNTASMCVMFSNICSFYSVSKSMNARESFDFINEYLHTIGPVIPKCHGFINEFLGYGVMALFPESTQADNSLLAALMIQKNVRAFNSVLSDRGQKAFEVSTAVHLCEKLIFGIVGFQSEVEDRLESTAIDEGVVLAETLEGTASKLGASILATESLIQGLSDSSKYCYRYLGMFIFENVNEPVNVYDVYQEDIEELRKLKEKTKEQFENAVSLYQQKEFQKAKELFIDIIGINNKDETAKIYFFLCDEYMKKMPRGWNKAIRL